MTALATSRFKPAKLVSISHVSESELRKERTLAGLQGIKSIRKPDIDLIADAFSFSEESMLQGKVIDLITTYRIVFEMRDELERLYVPACDRFIDELERCLKHFLDNGVLPERRMTFAHIFGPVAELADARIKKGM